MPPVAADEPMLWLSAAASRYFGGAFSGPDGRAITTKAGGDTNGNWSLCS